MSPDEIIASLQATILELRAIIQEQALVIERLQAENAELKRRLNQNSRNSSKPPSSDGPAKPTISSLRKKSGRKPGGQKGHTGHGFSLTEPVTDFVFHKPSQCAGCPLNGKCVSSGKSPVRYVVDVEIRPKVTCHQSEEYACPLLAGKVISGEFPDGINSSMQYGDGVRALAIALNSFGMMSADRTHKILTGILGLPISPGTISSMVSQFGSSINDTVQEIKTALLASPVVNCDETGTRVAGSTCWLHSACDSRYTYLSLQKKRGREGMEKAGFLPFYEGTIVHDCWGPYWSFPDVEHGLCCAHLLRELQGIIDAYPNAKWAKSMQNLLLKMNQIQKDAIADGMTALEENQVANLKRRYSIILGKARRNHAVSGARQGKKGKPLALIARMIKHKDEVCRFLKDFLTPFTNNLAEQSIRMMKVKTKVSGCFRTFAGGEVFSIIMSYLQTAQKKKIPAYTAVRNALAGKAHATIFA